MLRKCETNCACSDALTEQTMLQWWNKHNCFLLVNELGQFPMMGREQRRVISVGGVFVKKKNAKSQVLLSNLPEVIKNIGFFFR